MDTQNQNTPSPAPNPNEKKDEVIPVRNDEQPQQNERLWKHESEIPDRSSIQPAKNDQEQSESSD